MGTAPRSSVCCGASRASESADVVEPPFPLHNLPFRSLGSLFKGREVFLEQLTQNLGGDPATALTQHQALSGLGGIGETRLAVEYAWRSGPRYSAVLFVTVESPEGLKRDLTGLAGPRVLDLGLLEDANEDRVIGSVLGWLRANPGWLLILDNVDTPEAAQAVKALLPQLVSGRRALEIGEASLGADHHRVAIDLNNLAQLLQATNRLAEAEPLMRRALEICEESLGEEHPHTRMARGNLDILLAEMEEQKSR